MARQCAGEATRSCRRVKGLHISFESDVAMLAVLQKARRYEALI